MATTTAAAAVAAKAACAASNNDSNASGLPFFRPLSSSVIGSSVRTSFGDREWHVAGELSAADGNIRLVVVFGGWVESDHSEEIYALPIAPQDSASAATMFSSSNANWFCAGTSPVASRAGASLTPLLSSCSSSSSSSEVASSSKQLLLFGGLDIGDSYEALNDLHLVSVQLPDARSGNKLPSSSQPSSLPRIVFEKLPLLNGKDGEQPSRRMRHGACALPCDVSLSGRGFLSSASAPQGGGRNGSAAEPCLVIFGGEDDDSNVLGDAWLLFLVAAGSDVVVVDPSSSSSPTSPSLPCALWRRINLSVMPQAISPRAASCMFLATTAENSDVITLGIVGGLRYPREGEQESVQESFFVQIKAAEIRNVVNENESAASSRSSLHGAIVPMLAMFGGGELVPFPLFPVNTMLHASLEHGRRHLFFGGKDTVRGNDDLFLCCMRHEEQQRPVLDVVCIHRCPFKETVAVEFRQDAKKQHNEENDTETDSDAEVESSLSVLKRQNSDSAWPHWRYAAAALSFPATASRSVVVCIGGTARHPDPGCECVFVDV